MEDIKIVLLETIKEAGALVQSFFEKQQFTIDHKDGVNNLVTEVDQASERLIVERIKANFPDHGYIGEEYGHAHEEAEYQWVIDPIDGTVNFAHGVPLCCVSIGIAHKGEMVLGAVYNPMINELYFAEKGKGAYLNDKLIKVSQNANFETAFLVTGFPYHFPEKTDPVKIFSHFAQKKMPIRRLGSAALDLCWVATGRFDGFWEYNLQPWDIAAGMLIAAEAGAVCTEFNGAPMHLFSKELLVTNGKIHHALLSEIQSLIDE